MAPRTTVVTGANGYVASWIVKLLLERGHHVRGTVRDPDDSAKVAHLLELPGAQERLTLHRAVLATAQAFREVVDGADYVIHAAAPVIIGPEVDPWRDVVDPCVEGTLAVLRAAAGTSSVKRVVYTSSFVAVVISERFLGRKKGEPVDECWWSDEEFAEKRSLWYCLGKTRAERAVAEFAKEGSVPFDVVSINPPLCLGRALSGRASYGHLEVKRLLVSDEWKSDPFAELKQCTVAVQDVAEAHLLLLESPRAHGRYLVSESSSTLAQTARLISKMFPELSSVDLSGLDQADGWDHAAAVSSDKIRELGLEFTPPSVYLRETVEDLIAMGELGPRT